MKNVGVEIRSYFTMKVSVAFRKGLRKQLSIEYYDFRQLVEDQAHSELNNQIERQMRTSTWTQLEKRLKA
jgi:hypothetical protein